MRKLHIVLIILGFYFSGIGMLKAQQQFIYTQYMFNGLALNPAYAGSHDAISMTAFSRWQWVGIEGAPQTQTFSIHSPMPSNRVALGLLVINDKIGVATRQATYGMYAYQIQTGSVRISLGLQGGFTYYKEDLNKLDLDSKADNVFSKSAKAFLPNFGTGIFIYHDRGYFGFAIPELMNNRYDKDNTVSNARQKRHYFVHAGYVIPLNQNFKLKPNILLKYVDGAPLEMDINANLQIKNRVWVGASWRSFDSVDLLFELDLSNSLKFGYAYDFPTTEIRKSTHGSHEILLNYRIKYKKDKVVSPRYF